jgi:hypothetical protein
VQGNPITTIADRIGATRLSTRYERSITYSAEGQALSAQQEALLDALTAQLKHSLVRAQARDADVSVLQAVAPLLEQANNPARTRQWNDFILNSDLEHEYGGSAAELSAHWFDDAKEFGGGDELFAQGYGVITAALAHGLNIQTGHTVKAIHWASPPVRIVTQAGEFTADQVVVTLPLGVLKAQRVDFTPALPPDKQAAIAQLGMGLLNKCYLRFEKPFWPTDVDWIGHIATEPGAWTQWVSFMRAARQPVLLGFHAAQRARQIEAWTDQQTVADAMSTLRRLFGQGIPDPMDHQITRWAGDPFALGSYSFNALGSRPQMRRDLARPLAGRLFFAGEATEKDRFGTAHGALLSGERAAQEVLGT